MKTYHAKFYSNIPIYFTLKRKRCKVFLKPWVIYQNHYQYLLFKVR